MDTHRRQAINHSDNKKRKATGTYFWFSEKSSKNEIILVAKMIPKFTQERE
jgi:hypothetical protein